MIDTVALMATLHGEAELRAFLRALRMLPSPSSPAVKKRVEECLALCSSNRAGTSSDVAAIVGVSDRAVRKARAHGHLRGIWTGHEWVYTREAVLLWCDRRRRSNHSLRYNQKMPRWATGTGKLAPPLSVTAAARVLGWMALKSGFMVFLMKDETVEAAELPLWGYLLRGVAMGDTDSLISLLEFAEELGNARMAAQEQARRAAMAPRQRQQAEWVASLSTEELSLLATESRSRSCRTVQDLKHMIAARRAAIHLEEVSLI